MSESQIALVTGANRGLGYEVARGLARRGATVLVGARSLDDGRAAAERIAAEGFGAAPLQVDVSSGASVAAAAAEIDDRHGRLDVLVNNAGILPEATAGEGPVDLALFEATYDVNVFGAVRTVESMLPLLRRSAGARIVNVSSAMGSLNDLTDPSSPYYGLVVPAYQSSKAALNAVTAVLAKALVDPPIAVNSVDPGFVQTDLTPVNREQAPLSAETAAEVVVAAAAAGPDETGRFLGAAGEVPW